MTDIVVRLKRYIPLRMELENEQERRKRMQSLETYHKAQMSSLVNSRVDYEEKPPDWAVAIRNELSDIEQMISSLEDPLEREVLRMRYIEGDPEKPRPMRWGDVAHKLYGCKFICDGTRKSLQRTHNSAIENIKKSHP